MLRVRLWVHLLDPKDEEGQEVARKLVRIWIGTNKRKGISCFGSRLANSLSTYPSWCSLAWWSEAWCTQSRDYALMAVMVVLGILVSCIFAFVGFKILR